MEVSVKEILESIVESVGDTISPLGLMLITTELEE